MLWWHAQLSEKTENISGKTVAVSPNSLKATDWKVHIM
jgi:hypothetical protein